MHPRRHIPVSSSNVSPCKLQMLALFSGAKAVRFGGVYSFFCLFPLYLTFLYATCSHVSACLLHLERLAGLISQTACSNMAKGLAQKDVRSNKLSK